MPFQGLYSEFVDSKAVERLCTASKEVERQFVSDAFVFTPKTDIKQIKENLRNNHWSVDHPIRKKLWETLCNNVSPENHSELYYDVEKELFGESYLPSSLPSFIDPAYCVRYYLNSEGRKRVERILHVIRHIKPDITYCPVIYPLVSLLLHYMSDGMAFSCILKLLADRQNYISQTKSDHASSSYLVMKLAKKYARNAFLQLEKELKEHEDLESMFQNWLSWIFKGLPFSFLIRIVDCFLVEKKKTLYRVVIAVLVLYNKHADKVVNEDLGAMQKLLDFCQNMPVPVEKLFKTAYGIRGFSERVLNQQLLKVQMMLKSQSNLNMRSVSADHFDPTDPVYHVEMNSATQPIVKEMKLDASARTRSVGVVALGNFKSGIITAEQMSMIWDWLPLRISMLQPEVIYSSNEHGVCLTAFYMTVGPYEPTVLVIKAMNDEIFGAYCSSSWNSRNACDAENKKYSYFGTGETFLFTLVPEARKFAWVGCSASDDIPHSAKLFMAADNHMINVGAGNGQGLLLDDQLLHGRTEQCDTFNNEPLCSSKDFQCKVVEVIGFK